MSSAPSRRRKNEHAMRKHVQPYGDLQVAHLGMSERFDASLRIQDLFYLGDTQSAADFDIFPPHRTRKSDALKKIWLRLCFRTALLCFEISSWFMFPYPAHFH